MEEERTKKSVGKDIFTTLHTKGVQRSAADSGIIGLGVAVPFFPARELLCQISHAIDKS